MPTKVISADILTQYAVQTRYPGVVEQITQDEYLEARQLAHLVVAWAEKVLTGKEK